MSEPIRMGGMNSGLDTEAIIEAMMTTYQTKIDNQSKKLTMLQWQQEAYREVTKKLTDFQNKYFDVLKRDSYMMSPSTFNNYKADVTSTSGSTTGFSVTTSSSSVAGSYKVKVNQTAAASKLEGATIQPENFQLDFDKAINSAKFTDSEDGSTRTYEFAMDITVGSVTKTVDFTADATIGADGSVDTAALKDTMLEEFNTSLAVSFGFSGKTGDDCKGAVDPDTGYEWYLQAEMNDDGSVGFLVGGNINVSVAEKSGNFGLTQPADKVAYSPMSAVTGTNTLAVEVGGVTKLVSFEGVSSTYYNSKDAAEEFKQMKLAAYCRDKGLSSAAGVTDAMLSKYTYTAENAARDKNAVALNAALKSAFADENVSFTVTDTYISATKDGSSAQLSITSVEGGTFGITKGTVSNKINNNTKLEKMGIAAGDDGYALKINGVEIKVGANASISDLVSAVNKSSAGVTMSYSSLTNSFTLTAKDMGGSSLIEVEESDLTNALGLTGADTDFTLGHNAILEINGEEIYLNDNSYTLEGTTFKFTDDIAIGETFTVGLSRNTDDVKELIKGFVEDYNTLIDEVYDYIGTAPKTDSSDNRFEPLTDAEKEAMSEEEIKTWEENAKIGILYNDSTISGIMSKMRSVLYNAVDVGDGKKIGLYNLGIKTSDDYADHGKLEIDETKLDKLLSEDPEAITTLFTDAENGIMKKMDSVIDSAVLSTGSADKRGSLIRKAGLESGSTAIDNAIFKQMESIRERISDLQDRYEAREEYWWSVFTNLESMMSDLNSQSSYLTSYLGTPTTY